MPECKLANFDILIQGESAPYSVLALYNGSSERGSFAPDILASEWQQAYRALAQSMNTPDADAIMAIGSRLWAALMHGHVRDLWIAARNDLEQERVEGLRLRLDLQPPLVAALPWESLYEEERSVIFATHPQFALVRAASIYRHVGPRHRHQVQLPLRMLIVAPDDPSETIDSQREIAELHRIMDNFGPETIQVEELTGPFQIMDLRAKLAKIKPTILHFIGHGDPRGLEFWPRGRQSLISPQSLRSILERSPSTKLVFLNACLAGRSAHPRPFTSVAEQSLQAGVPAIIAMQHLIRDDVAIDFAHFLYEELLGGTCPGIIDLAMNAARSALYSTNPGDFSFGTPVLWLNRDQGSIFSLDKPAEGSKGVVEEIPAPPKLPTLNLQEESEWLDEMVASTDVENLPGELAFLRSKWTNYVEELRSLLLQLVALSPQPDSLVFEEKVNDYRRYKAALLRVKRLIEDTRRSS